jgi:hypothetical protein
MGSNASKGEAHSLHPTDESELSTLPALTALPNEVAVGHQRIDCVLRLPTTHEVCHLSEASITVSCFGMIS